MTPYVKIVVVNRPTNKVLFERIITGVPFEQIPFSLIADALSFLYQSFEHSILFDCSIIKPIVNDGK